MLETLVKFAGWIPLFPLLGALFNAALCFTGARLVRSIVHTVACGCLFLSFLLSVAAFLHVLSLPEEARQWTVTFFPWIHVGGFSADVAFLIDPLSLTLMLVITGVGFLIHVYSIGYMSHEPSYGRYFTYLNLFCFAMLVLVMGANLPMMFIGWEGVGLCSYLLIGFWFTDIQKATAGMKAFVVNRIGDFAFIIGFLLLYWTLHGLGHPTVTFTELRAAAPLLEGHTWLGMSVITWICLLFFGGATGKSAQIPLYVWLPDAMAGPTPVSALIHAATMVTAGVYMIGRLSFLFSLSPTALNVVAVVGFATAFLAAIIGFAQNDIKKVLAYSTVSQLGYMFGAMGVAAYTAGIFHLVTHAFFKACLFLGSGSVIHAMSGEQDMRKMGGLKSYLPITYKTFFIATLAIAGIFPFAGFFSKDEILWQTFNRMPALWVLGALAAAGTALYMFRLVAMTFYGESRADEETRHHIHESPKTMTFALIVLALLSLAGGFLGVPESLGHLVGWDNSSLIGEWLRPSLVEPKGLEVVASAGLEYGLMMFSLFLAVAGCSAGYLLYTRRQDIPEKIVLKFPRLYRFVENKYFVDEFYDIVFVKNLVRLTRLMARFDSVVIDGVVNLTGTLTKFLSIVSGWFDQTFVDGLINLCAVGTGKIGAGFRKMQTGKIQTYLYYATGAILLVMAYRFFL